MGESTKHRRHGVIDLNGSSLVGHLTATNSVTGFTIRDQFSDQGIIDFVGGEFDGFTARGVGFHWTIPGEGIVIIQVGRVVFDSDFNVVFLAGPQDVREGLEVLCDALD